MTRLNSDLILDTAMAMIEGDGESALSMRALAARLEVTPMALYRYFDDRDALLIAIVERVSERIDFPDSQGTPIDRVVALALCLHDFLLAHPWMIRLISTGRLASPAGLRFPEGFLDCARDAGFNDEDAFVFYRMMFSVVIGQATITHAKNGAAASIPDHAHVSGPPTVAALAPQWGALDQAATATRIFRAAAASLHS